jgi:hypothetical protein
VRLDRDELTRSSAGLVVIEGSLDDVAVPVDDRVEGWWSATS